jgi:hypothetical protein
MKSKGLSIRTRDLGARKLDCMLFSKKPRGSLTILLGEGVRGVPGHPITDQRTRLDPRASSRASASER